MTYPLFLRGPQGELIFRYVYEKAGCDKPVRRLWISSMTPDAIREGFDALKDGADFEPLHGQVVLAQGRQSFARQPFNPLPSTL